MSRTEAWETLRPVYEAHERQVFRYAFHLVGDRALAEDIRQQTFLRALRTPTLLRGDDERAARAKLLRICTGFCRDQRRFQRRSSEGFGGALYAAHHHPAHTYSVPQEVVTPALAEAVAALRDLPVGEREALALRDLEGMREDEAARILGCPSYLLKRRLSRARRHFGEALLRHRSVEVAFSGRGSRRA